MDLLQCGEISSNNALKPNTYLKIIKARHGQQQIEVAIAWIGTCRIEMKSNMQE